MTRCSQYCHKYLRVPSTNQRRPSTNPSITFEKEDALTAGRNQIVTLNSDFGFDLQITLQYPDEYVMQVKGSTYTWPVIQGTIVSSLTFITNKKVYGPFGKESEAKFESLPGGRVVGFFGRSGTLIDQFGVLAYPSSGYTTTTTTTTTTYTTSSSVDQERTVYVEGPYGGNGGVIFNDGYSRIVEIIITYNKKQVTSLQVAYEHGGSVFKGLRHGIHAGEEAKVCANSLP